MTSATSAIERYYALNPTRFPFLERLELRQAITPERWCGLTVAVDLRASDAEDHRLTLSFFGVRDLRFGRLEGLLQLLVEIHSIRDQQWEGLRYRVVESEHSAFAFVCADFEARVITTTAASCETSP